MSRRRADLGALATGFAPMLGREVELGAPLPALEADGGPGEQAGPGE